MTYRRKNSLRGKGFDFSQPAFYFITISVKDRLKILGEVKDDKVILSEIGKIVDDIWNTIPDHYLLTKLHARQVMPDHFHGIIEIIYGNPRHESVSVMVNQVKGAVTKQIKLLGLEVQHPIWQRSFHCEAFWMTDDFEKVEKYIIDNPKNYLKKNANIQNQGRIH
ncbi:MAG TPA: transposase [Bacteroidia bacterium]|nr:transposase [Bacteroidia bacterium]